jgi:hypothetical protein
VDAVPDDGLRWSPAVWTASHAELFARFRELSDELAVLSEEVRAFLDASRVENAGLNVLDFGGGTGELVATASRTHDRVVIFDPVRDPSSALVEQGPAFDALVFSHVLALVADPQALFGELATYSQPRASALAVVLDDTGTQADICREAARTDSHFLDHFGHAQHLERLFADAETQFRSHTVASRAIASSQDDLLTVVAFFLDAAVDELVKRLASAIPREPDGDWILTTHHRVFAWNL